MAALLLAAANARAEGGDRLLDELVRTRTPGFVFDRAGVVSGEHRARIAGVLEELEAKTGAQVKVVTLKSLDGGEIHDFATRLYERWGIGAKGTDEGVLLLAAIEDRVLRIEVGYGLEAVITDATAGRVRDGRILPRFRDGDFGGGLTAGAEAIAELIAASRGVTLVSPGDRPAASNDRGPGDGAVDRIPTPILILMVIVFIYLAVRHPEVLIWMMLSGHGGGGGFRGGGFGGRGGFGGFGGGRSGGGGATGRW